MNFNEYVRDSGTCLSLHRKDVDIKELVTFLRDNPSIKELSIKYCEISDKGAEALAQSEHLKNLTSLNLDLNQISDEGAKALAKSEHLKNLTSLNLGLNQIGDEGAEALANGKLASLISLDLYDNEIGDEGAEALANGNFTNLTSLNLASNQIGDEGIAALTEGLEKGNFPKLTDLSFTFKGTNYSGNQIKILKDEEANRVARNTAITCGVITALAVGIGCGVAGYSILAIAGIAVAAALVVGILAGGIAYVALTPSDKLDNLNSEPLKGGITV